MSKKAAMRLLFHFVYFLKFADSVRFKAFLMKHDTVFMARTY